MAGLRTSPRHSAKAPSVPALLRSPPTGSASCLETADSRSRVERHHGAADPDEDPDAPATLSTSVDRQTLREILGAGLGDRVRFGHELARFDQDDNQVFLRFSGGQRASVDVLVAPTGSTPRCACSICRMPRSRSSDRAASMARLGWTRRPCRWCRRPCSTVSSPSSAAMSGWATGLMQFRRRPELEHVAEGLVRSCHPDLRALIGRADARQTFFIPGCRLAARCADRSTPTNTGVVADRRVRGRDARPRVRRRARLTAGRDGECDARQQLAVPARSPCTGPRPAGLTCPRTRVVIWWNHKYGDDVRTPRRGSG